MEFIQMDRNPVFANAEPLIDREYHRWRRRRKGRRIGPPMVL
jgi:hypothetical protein